MGVDSVDNVRVAPVPVQVLVVPGSPGKCTPNEPALRQEGCDRGRRVTSHRPAASIRHGSPTGEGTSDEALEIPPPLSSTRCRSAPSRTAHKRDSNRDDKVTTLEKQVKDLTARNETLTTQKETLKFQLQLLKMRLGLADPEPESLYSEEGSNFLKLVDHQLATRNIAQRFRDLRELADEQAAEIIALKNANDLDMDDLRRETEEARAVVHKDFADLDARFRAAAAKHAEEMRKLRDEQKRSQEKLSLELEEIQTREKAAARNPSDRSCEEELRKARKTLSELRKKHDLKIEELDFSEYLNRLLCEWVWEHECKLRNIVGKDARLHLYWAPNRSPWKQKVGDRYMHGRLLSEGEGDIVTQARLAS